MKKMSNEKIVGTIMIAGFAYIINRKLKNIKKANTACEVVNNNEFANACDDNESVNKNYEELIKNYGKDTDGDENSDCKQMLSEKIANSSINIINRSLCTLKLAVCKSKKLFKK